MSRERTGCLVNGFLPEAVRRIRSGPPGRSLPSIFQSSSRQDRSQIMLVLHGFLIIAVCLVTIAILPAMAKAIYDQRQTGDVNVQIDLKDLQVIALVNSELLDDYTVNPFLFFSLFLSLLTGFRDIFFYFSYQFFPVSPFLKFILYFLSLFEKE